MDKEKSEARRKVMSEIMTADQAIEAVKNGGRCVTKFTNHIASKPSLCPYGNHRWRTVACNDVQDVLECSICGEQVISSCDFDEEFS